jgi:GT2 family glycosyltransferase
LTAPRMTASVRVTLCIINYNGAEHLGPAFAALQAQSWPFAELLLIDNASDDDSRALARTLCPAARIIQLPANRGPAAARNAGFAAATNDLILFQDNDVRLGVETAARLVAHLAEHPDCLAVAPRVLYETDPTIVQFDSADCHFLGFMATRHADMPVADTDTAPAPTTSMVSACFLINRRLWRGGQPFDESLGFNLEDHDFGVRARLAGYSLWVQPAATVRHGSGTAGLSYRPGQRPAEARLFYLTLNRWLIVLRCYAARTLVLLSPALLAVEFMQVIWLTSEGRAAAWWRALRSLLARRQRLLAERRAIQRDRRVGDAEILRDGPLPLTRHVRQRPLGRTLAAPADIVLRAYWRAVRRWVPA